MRGISSVIKGKAFWWLCLVSFLLGILASLALPPVGFIWVLPLALPIFLELLQRLPDKKSQFLFGWCFGYGHFIFSLSWIGNALMVEADKFAWMKPISLLGIPAFLACYIGVVAVITGFARSNRYMMWWMFALAWVLLELARSYLIFPFPWNLLGYSFAPSLVMSQFASVIGIYGLSWLLVLAGSVLFTRSVIAISLICLLMGSVYLWGYEYLKKEGVDEGFITLRLVQPSPPHHHLGDVNERASQIRKLVFLSQGQPSASAPDAIVWPEGVLPLIGHDQVLKTIASLLPRESWLLTGADRVTNDHLYHNSIISSTPEGDVASYYDKHILVPFGEYIPLRWLLPAFIEKVAYGMGDFTIGKEYSVIKVGDNYAVPLICYESLFSLFVNNFPLARAGFLLNVTNDDWFGDSLGPYQHLAMAKFRAIEYGKPLVRVANSGISMAVDFHGRELASIPLGASKAIDLQIKLVLKETTFYCANIFLLGCILIINIIISLAAMFLLNRSRSSN